VSKLNDWEERGRRKEERGERERERERKKAKAAEGQKPTGGLYFCFVLFCFVLLIHC
jgi:hypothetical protein